MPFPALFSLQACYDVLRAMPEIGHGIINLEGLASSADQLYMLQRGNISGLNVVITYDLRSFYEWMTGKTYLLPAPAIQPYSLLSLAGIQAGFSGATLVPNTSILLFTASLENTSNEIDDGESLGSLIGLIDLHQPDTIQTSCLLLMEDGQPYRGKVESIAVLERSGNTIRAIAVTDNDLGGSEMMEIELRW